MCMQMNAWRIDLEDEYLAQIRSGTWEIVPRPRGRKVIGSCFVFCTKNTGKREKEGETRHERVYIRTSVNGIACGIQFRDASHERCYGVLEWKFGGRGVHGESRIYLKQHNCIENVLERFGMKDCKPVSTLIESNCKLSRLEHLALRSGEACVTLCKGKIYIRSSTKGSQ